MPLTALMSSWTSGYLAKLGRRTALLNTNLIAIIATLFFVFSLSQKTFNIMIIGRILAGIAVGLGHSLVPLYIKEMSPVSLSGRVGMFHQLLVMTGVLIAAIIGISISQDNSDLIWLYLMFAFPLLTNGLSSIFFLTVFNSDTPKFFIIKG